MTVNLITVTLFYSVNLLNTDEIYGDSILHVLLVNYIIEHDDTNLSVIMEA